MQTNPLELWLSPLCKLKYVPSPNLNTPHSIQSEGAQPFAGLNRSTLACDALAVGGISDAAHSAFAAPAAQGPAVTGDSDSLSPTHREAGVVGLAPV